MSSDGEQVEVTVLGDDTTDEEDEQERDNLYGNDIDSDDDEDELLQGNVEYEDDEDEDDDELMQGNVVEDNDDLLSDLENEDEDLDDYDEDEEDIDEDVEMSDSNEHVENFKSSSKRVKIRASRSNSSTNSNVTAASVHPPPTFQPASSLQSTLSSSTTTPTTITLTNRAIATEIEEEDTMSEAAVIKSRLDLFCEATSTMKEENQELSSNLDAEKTITAELKLKIESHLYALEMLQQDKRKNGISLNTMKNDLEARESENNALRDQNTKIQNGMRAINTLYEDQQEKLNETMSKKSLQSAELVKATTRIATLEKCLESSGKEVPEQNNDDVDATVQVVTTELKERYEKIILAANTDLEKKYVMLNAAAEQQISILNQQVSDASDTAVALKKQLGEGELQLQKTQSYMKTMEASAETLRSQLSQTEEALKSERLQHKLKFAVVQQALDSEQKETTQLRAKANKMDQHMHAFGVRLAMEEEKTTSSLNRSTLPPSSSTATPTTAAVPVKRRRSEVDNDEEDEDEGNDSEERTRQKSARTEPEDENEDEKEDEEEEEEETPTEVVDDDDDKEEDEEEDENEVIDDEDEDEETRAASVEEDEADQVDIQVDDETVEVAEAVEEVNDRTEDVDLVSPVVSRKRQLDVSEDSEFVIAGKRFRVVTPSKEQTNRTAKIEPGTAPNQKMFVDCVNLDGCFVTLKNYAPFAQSLDGWTLIMNGATGVGSSLVLNSSVFGLNVQLDPGMSLTIWSRSGEQMCHSASGIVWEDTDFFDTNPSSNYILINTEGEEASRATMEQISPRKAVGNVPRGFSNNLSQASTVEVDPEERESRGFSFDDDEIQRADTSDGPLPEASSCVIC